jgi:CheY-like chemotaxis protein/HPt (histidine-containing phosphotransfer) domain-containing protein
MSHELRTPLNAILGFSQLFEYDPSLGKQRQSNARAIHNAGQHLLTLIDEILDLSRIEAGRIDFSIESVPLEAVIKDSLTWVADMADSRGISIDFNPEVFRGMLVEADTIRLKQVFLNLITNAVKYNHENGSVSIAGSRCENDCIRISITDTGPGIASDRLSDLFKPFNRLGAEFSGVEGTGIGLVITRQLVNLMDGELEVESSLGIGSTFTVQLKTSNSQITDNTQSTVNFDLAPVAEFPESEIKPHLLIAEDNQVNQDLMDAQLKLLGYSADYADNGVEALKLWKTGNYQLLLTDIRMPKMDGYELIRQIRAMNSVAAASPIIAVTANALESDVKQCMDTGASDFISKPFGLDDLRQILQKWSTQLEGTGAVTATPLQSPKITPDEAIDLSVLKLMVGDNIELHHKLLTTYIVTLPEALDDIQQAFDARNHDLLGEYAHKLKSSSGSLGVTRIANICRLLELACSEGRESEINQLVPELALAAEAVFVFVRAFCN